MMMNPLQAIPPSGNSAGTPASMLSSLTQTAATSSSPMDTLLSGLGQMSQKMDQVISQMMSDLLGSVPSMSSIMNSMTLPSMTNPVANPVSGPQTVPLNNGMATITPLFDANGNPAGNNYNGTVNCGAAGQGSFNLNLAQGETPTIQFTPEDPNNPIHAGDYNLQPGVVAHVTANPNGGWDSTITVNGNSIGTVFTPQGFQTMLSIDPPPGAGGIGPVQKPQVYSLPAKR